jgi:rubrerythrin
MELDEAIRAAIEYEAGVHRTYQEAAEQTTDEAGKRVFKVLCDEEMSLWGLLGRSESSLAKEWPVAASRGR